MAWSSRTSGLRRSNLFPSDPAVYNGIDLEGHTRQSCSYDCRARQLRARAARCWQFASQSTCGVNDATVLSAKGGPLWTSRLSQRAEMLPTVVYVNVILLDQVVENGSFTGPLPSPLRTTPGSLWYSTALSSWSRAFLQVLARMNVWGLRETCLRSC